MTARDVVWGRRGGRWAAPVESPLAGHATRIVAVGGPLAGVELVMQSHGDAAEVPVEVPCDGGVYRLAATYEWVAG